MQAITAHLGGGRDDRVLWSYTSLIVIFHGHHIDDCGTVNL